MPYTQSEMLYNKDGYYKWSARADHDNPYYKKGTDYSELNKTEGYEVLYFINHLAGKRWTNPTLGVYQKIEKAVRYSIPPKSTHAKAEEYICGNWNSL